MSSDLKVLQVIPKLGYGGAETGCYDIAHYLAEQECNSYIATSGGELLKFVKKNKVKVFKLPVDSKNPILNPKKTKKIVLKILDFLNQYFLIFLQFLVIQLFYLKTLVQ